MQLCVAFPKNAALFFVCLRRDGRVEGGWGQGVLHNCKMKWIMANPEGGGGRSCNYALPLP